MIIIEQYNAATRFITTLNHEQLKKIQKSTDKLSAIRGGDNMTGSITHWSAEHSAIKVLNGYCERSGHTFKEISF